MKILNLFAGIGGNRWLWGEEHQITAVEINGDIAEVYKKLFPNDTVIIGDAHQYLLDNFREFDFIWTSPPCVTHTKLRTSHPDKIVYPDMRLYQEIILLQQWFKGKFCVENVEPYYPELIKPSAFLDRHYFWTNFNISDYHIPKANKDVSRDTIEGLSEFKGINLTEFNITEKRLLLRNAVHPKLGLHILKNSLKKIQKRVGDFTQPSTKVASNEVV